MRVAADIFTSPELYPLKIDLRRRAMTFVHMTPDSYRDSVFLDGRTRHVGADVYEIRLDDLLFAHANLRMADRPVHYILHTAYCCSTLLARYFELLPSCFVLKEPRLLTQVALGSYRGGREWEDAFRLSVRLLTRTYAAGQHAVIKVNDWCNTVGPRLLRMNRHASITFLMMPLRHFVLAVLKSAIRRQWVHTRINAARQDAAACPALATCQLDNLTDAEASAYLWLVNSVLCAQLAAEDRGGRVLVLDGGQIADAPAEALRKVFRTCGLTLRDDELGAILAHPSVRSYSKDLSRPYDATSRQQELADLEARFGREADAAIAWAAAQGISGLEGDDAVAAWPAVNANSPARV